MQIDWKCAQALNYQNIYKKKDKTLSHTNALKHTNWNKKENNSRIDYVQSWFKQWIPINAIEFSPSIIQLL